jgi:hypothetical protein
MNQYEVLRGPIFYAAQLYFILWRDFLFPFSPRGFESLCSGR